MSGMVDLRWKPLPEGGFTGTSWAEPGAIDDQDPYLIWAEANHFAGYTHRHRGQSKTKWLPIVIELSAEATVASLVAASHTKWLQIPQVYLTIPGLRYCSARVKPGFFKNLRSRPAFKQLIARYELGLPVGQHTHSLHNPCKPASSVDSTHPVASEPLKLSGKVLGLIDGGLALGNSAWRNGQSGTRLKYFWRQDSDYSGPWPSQNLHGEGTTPLAAKRAGPTPLDMGYGHELDVAAINKAMKRCTPKKGTLDEQALYRHLQLWDLARPVNHGTHVMSLASGTGVPQMSSDDPASHCDLVAVQLDWSNILDTSGGAMNVSVLDGLMFILARCSDTAEVVVNISWGTLAGPHDGTSILEAAMDQLIDLLGGRLQITVPAGNAYQSRTHANDTLQERESRELSWRIQPDDRTESFLEIWLPEGSEKVAIEITPPGASSPLPPLRPGQAGVWASTDPSTLNHPVCALIYPRKTALGMHGTCALVALAPTFSFLPKVVTSPFGAWKVKLTNHGPHAVTFDAYIERDDVALGQQTGARQSYFEDVHYDTSGNLDSYVDHAENPSPIRRSGTFNSLSTGKRTVSVGGTRRDFDPALGPLSRFARYSPQAPDPDSARPQRPNVKKVPDTLRPCDDNAALWGVLGSATLSGSMTRLAGTSSAAPQQARAILDEQKLVSDKARTRVSFDARFSANRE